MRRVHFRIVVTPNFNLAATLGFVDPFRAANYLEGVSHFSWDIASEAGGACLASNGLSVQTETLKDVSQDQMDFLVLSSSWTPEQHATPAVQAALRQAVLRKVPIAGLDTGAFIMAEVGLLEGRRATVHYEHIDAFRELYPNVDCTEAVFEFDEDRITCCGGAASFDCALQILRGLKGNDLANAAARYVFHANIREPGAPQNPQVVEPLGAKVPDAVRNAILAMEQNLEEPLPMPEICAAAKISHRQLNRLFAQYLRKTPALYYRDIRLDRARGLVTQTSLPMSEIAYACGFSSQVHFSRAYKERFGLPPIKDRVEGRIPFEFRAWPMHRKRRTSTQ